VRLVDLGKSQSLIVVSDVHMRHPDEERTKLFCKFLAELPSCDTLVLLGDIFDFINARQVFYYNYWQQVFSLLSRLRERGIKVVFIEGNHDYGFQHGTHPEVKSCFDYCGDFWAKLDHQQLGQVLLLHSDDVVCPPSYLLFRALVKSKLFQWMASPIPGETTQALFSKVAKASRSRDDYRRLSASFLTDCVDRLLTLRMPQLNYAPDLCVFGHIHVPLDDHRRQVRFVSAPDWFSAPSYLHFNQSGEVRRGWLTSDSQSLERFCFSGESLESSTESQK
jgi:UDP-2,3-diacylglucosamine hydrolase